MDGVKLGFRCNAAEDELCSVRLDRVCVLPCFDFLLRSVCGGVGGGVTRCSVCDDLQHCGAFAAEKEILLSRCCVDDCERVITVDGFRVHLIGIYARADSRRLTPSHRFALRLTAHSVEVVEHVEEYRKSAALAPELSDLVHGGHIERFENGTSAECAVAGVCYDDAFFVIGSLIERRAHCDCRRAADDSVVREYTEGNEECVHRSAKTAVEACSSCKNFGKRTVEKEVDCEILHVALDFLSAFDNGKNGAVEEGFHYVVKLGIVEFLYRGKSLCDDFAVASVRAEGEVAVVKAVSLTDGGRLLTERKVSGAGVVVFNAVINALCFDFVEHGFKLADDSHVAINIDEILL